MPSTARARGPNGQFLPRSGRVVDVASTRTASRPRPARRRGDVVVLQVPAGVPAAATSQSPKRRRRRRGSVGKAGAAMGRIGRVMIANPIPTVAGAGVGAGVQLAIPADRPEGGYVIAATAATAYLGRTRLPAPVVAAAGGATMGGAAVYLARKVDTVQQAAEWVAVKSLAWFGQE